MKTGPYTIWVYWPNRQEDAHACATRLARTFEDLVVANSAFSQWYRKADKLADAFRPFCAMPPQIEELAKIFQKGQHRKDVPPDPWPELGYSVYAWNGISDARGLWFHAHVGSYDDSRVFPNIMTIDVRSYSPENADLIDAGTLRAALMAVVTAWDGAWGCVDSALYTKRIYEGKSFARGQPAPPPFRSGWMIYLSAPLAANIAPPSEAIVEVRPKGGLLMRATDDVFSVENPSHLAAADAIQRALEPLQFDPRVLDAQIAQRRLGL